VVPEAESSTDLSSRLENMWGLGLTTLYSLWLGLSGAVAFGAAGWPPGYGCLVAYGPLIALYPLSAAAKRAPEGPRGERLILALAFVLAFVAAILAAAQGVYLTERFAGAGWIDSVHAVRGKLDGTFLLILVPPALVYGAWFYAMIGRGDAAFAWGAGLGALWFGLACFVWEGEAFVFVVASELMLGFGLLIGALVALLFTLGSAHVLRQLFGPAPD
jgi:hypothetical protein